jgi:hypothetical protein
MKYNTLEILKNVVKAVEDPVQLGENIKNFSHGKILSKLNLEELNRSVGNYGIEPEGDEEAQYDNTDNEIDSNDNNLKSYNEGNSYRKKDMISENRRKKEEESLANSEDEPLDLMESITKEITPIRLQQAIILSEIVSKPRCKMRKRRRF